MLSSKVLVVDDAPAITDALCQVLERLGVAAEDIFKANTLEAALEVFRRERPGLVFMDINLGAEAGDQAALRILSEAPSTKVVVMTGMDVQDPRVRAVVSAGAFDVIPKPLRLARLKQLLDVIDSEEKGFRRI